MVSDITVSGKSVSYVGETGGLYAAIVDSVDGVDVYLTIPKLSDEFVHGPVVYDGDLPQAGDHALVGFLEGNPDDVVAIFPGSGGMNGPVEPTYIIASSEAPAEVKAIADYVCDGVHDEEEINAAINTIDPDRYVDKTILLTGGVFYCEGVIATLSWRWYGTLKILGTGMESTQLYFFDVWMPGARGVIDFAYYAGDVMFYNLGIYWEYNSSTYDEEVWVDPPLAIISARHIELYYVNLYCEDWAVWGYSTPSDAVLGTIALDVTSLIVSDCIIYHTGKVIDIYPQAVSEKRIIRRNDITSVGVVLDTHSAYEVYVTDNHIVVDGDYPPEVVLDMFFAFRSVVSGNFIHTIDTPAIWAGNFRCVVTGNYLEHGWYYADEGLMSIKVDGTGHVISNNVITGTPGGPGIHVYGGNYSTITDNIIYWPAMEAIKVENFYNVTVTNNHVVAASSSHPSYSITGAFKVLFSGNSIDDTNQTDAAIYVDDCDYFTISNSYTDEI